MSQFPKAEAEIAVLEGFVAATPEAVSGNDAAMGALRAQAVTLVSRLRSPVRVAVAGRPDGGAAAVLRFLAGRDLGLETQSGAKTPPMMVVHGATLSTVAGWWSGKYTVFDGLDPRAAARIEPDYIELRLPSPILQDVSFLTIPSGGDAANAARDLAWVAARADIAIWCTAATDAWAKEDQQLWAGVPQRLHKKSLLVATSCPPTEQALTLRDRLRAQAISLFQDAMTLDTQAAIAAAPSGTVKDAAAFGASGGRDLVGRVMTLALATRKREIDAVRVLIEGRILPAGAAMPGVAPERPTRKTFSEEALDVEALTPLPDLAPEPNPDVKADLEVEAKPVPTPDEKLEALPEPEPMPEPEPELEPEPEPKPKPKAKPKTNKNPDPKSDKAPDADPTGSAVLDRFRTRLDALIAQVEQPIDAGDRSFLRKCTDLTQELSVMLATPGMLNDGAEWVTDQIDEAHMQLTLLELEPGEGPLQDAAGLLLQLGRDLAWAAASGQDG